MELLFQLRELVIKILICSIKPYYISYSLHLLSACPAITKRYILLI